MSTNQTKASGRRGSGALALKLEELGSTLETQLESPDQVLDLMVNGLAKGQRHPELWPLLHDAAVRDDKLAELAFAYEHIASDKRIKLLAPELQAEIFMHAASFFGEVFGDPDGSVAYAQRVLSVIPGHPEAFGWLEKVLSEQGATAKLAQLYVDRAGTLKDAEQQHAALQRAATLVEGLEGADELAIEVFQRILRATPDDQQARDALERHYRSAGRPKDAAQLLEQWLLRDPPLSEEDKKPLHERLLGLYMDELGEPQRAVPHVEALLADDPAHERALKAAETLLELKPVASRAAAALSDAYERQGHTEQAVAMLTQELKGVRGPRRIEVQRRLGVLKMDAMGDPAGALQLLGPVLAGDPGDDDLRRRFVELSLTLDKPLEAARLLSRALQTSRDEVVKSKVSAEIGSVYLRAGDVKRARTSFQQALDIGKDGGATLEAARQLAEMYGEAGDIKQLGAMLELVVRHEQEKEPRQAAARRLARLCEGELDDPNRALVAYKVLVDSPWADDALQKLEALCEQTGDVEGMIQVLEKRADRAKDKMVARDLRFKAAEMRSVRPRDRKGALEAWRGILQRYGPSRDLHERMIPLLEHEQEWGELADVLEKDVELADRADRPALLAKLAQLRMTRLQDAAGALGAFRQALAIDPGDAAARAAVEKALGSDEVGLAAAEILEPIYRSDDTSAGLVRVLETRGKLAAQPEERLAALAEAVGIAESELNDPARGLELAGRGLREAVASQRDALTDWLERARRFAEAAGDPTARADVLLSALGQNEIDSDAMLELARATGDALVACGEVGQAIETYRRALEFAPASTELMQRIEELLAQQGTPEERMAFYQSALEQQVEPARRRELLHAMARLQQRDMGDPEAAVKTWQLALADDPKDFGAHQALVEAYGALERWNDVYGELERMLAHVEGERRSLIELRMAEVAAEHGDPGRALSHFRSVMGNAELPDRLLGTIEQLAREHGDGDMVRAVLERRIEGSTDPHEQADLLEKLGDAQAAELGDPRAAAASWLNGARLSEGAAADEARAIRLYERALNVAPDEREAAERLVDLYAKSGAWDRIYEAFMALLGSAGLDREAIALLMSLEEPAAAAGALDAFGRLVSAAIAKQPEPVVARRLILAKVRVLETDPSRHDEVADLYRQLIESAGEEGQAEVDAFEQFLQRTESTPARVQDRRWLYKWRSQHAADPATVLVNWAIAEEHEFGNAEAAMQLYQQVLELDAERTDALTELARLRAVQGDAEGALESLRTLRDRSDEATRQQIDMSMASLLDQLGRPSEALDVVEPLLQSGPADDEMLRVVHGGLADPSTRARAAALLDKASAAAEDPEARARVLETLLSVSADTPELSDMRSGWLRRLLEVRGDDPEAGLKIALRGAEDSPTDQELWDAAERFSRKLNQPEALADAYARALDKELPADEVEELGRRMVEFHEEWFEDTERVVGLLQRIVRLAPGASWAFDRLKLAFNAAGRWAELFDLYDQALERATEDDYRIELLREASMAAKDFAADPDRAIAYLEQLNQLSPHDQRVESALERLYERHGHTRPLIELLDGQLEKATPAARQHLRARIASLWLDLNEPLPAFEKVEAMLSDKPPVNEVWELLERLVALPAARESVVPPAEGEGSPKKKKKKRQRLISVRDRCAVYLREHYEKLGQTSDVVRMLEVEVETAPSEEDRIGRLREIARVRIDELEDHAGAFQTLAELVRLEPTDTGHREQLADLAEKIDAQEGRADLLVNVAEAAQDVTLQVTLLGEAASIHQEKLGHDDRAIDLYLQVLTMAGDERDHALPAARQLDGLLDKAGRSAERCSVLEKRAELETDREARREALGEAARVAADVLNDPDRAIRDWRARLGDDSRDGPALDGLIDALTRSERHSELIEALTTRAELSQDADQARSDRVRIARTRADQLGDQALAVEAWRQVEHEHGRDLEVFDALVELLGQLERWSELAELLQSEADRTEDQERQRGLLGQLGELHRTRTGDVKAALEAFVAAGDWESAVAVAGAGIADKELGVAVCRRLLDMAVDAWQGAADDAAAGPARAAEWAVEELSQRLREEGQHQDVVDLLLRGSKLPFERTRQRALQREAACLVSDRLEDSERAIAIFRDLFEDDPSDEIASSSVTRMALLLEESGLHDEIVGLWETQARCRQQSGDAAASAALWARAAELAEERLQDLERAVTDHRKGAGLGGEASLEALARIFEQQDQPAQAAEVLEWLCAQSPREALAERALRLAEAYVAAGQEDRARARLQWAATTALDAVGVRKRLAELYRDAELWAPLADLLAADAGRAPDTKTRLALLREAAALHLDKRGEPNSAVPLLQQAVEVDADDPQLRLALSDALSRAERYEEAAAILREQIERYGARRPKGRAVVHLQLAKVSMAAGRRAESLSELDAAAKIDPAHPDILQALARLAFEEDQLDRAEKTYRALLLVLGPGRDDGPSRAEALLDLSEIATRRDDPVRATEFVESAFEAALESEREALALEQALRKRDRTELLARAVETRLESAHEPRDAARALADLAILHAESLGGVSTIEDRLRERAQRIHGDLESADTADEGAWSALARVYDFLGDSEAEARVLERRVAALLNSSRVKDAEPFYKLAEVRLKDSATVEQGLDLLQRALDTDPDHARAGRFLREAVDADPQNERAVRLLERVVRQSGDEQALAEALSLVVQLPGAHKSELKEGVELAKKHDDLPLAEAMLRSVVNDELDDSDGAWALSELADLCEARGDLGEALDLRERAAAGLGPVEQRAMLLSVARAASEAAPKRAAGIYESLLENEPADREVWEPLLDVLRALGDGERLVKLIDQTVPLVDSLPDRARLRLEQATIMLDQTGDVDAGIELLKEILQEDPTQLRAAELLGSLYEKQDRRDELAELLSFQLDAAKDRQDTDSIISMSMRLGALLEQQERADDALDTYRAVLDWDKGSKEALRAVLRLSKQSGDAFLIGDAIEALLKVESGDEAEQLVGELIALREEQGDDLAVERALELSVGANPANLERREDLLRRYGERADHAGMARVLQMAVDAEPDNAELVERLVTAYREAGETDQALEVVDRVIGDTETVDPVLLRERGTLRVEAGREEEGLADLEAAYAASGEQPEALVNALEQAILRAEPERAHELTLRLAEVALATGDLDGARVRLNELLGESPKDQQALSQLAALEAKSENWDAAATAYRKLIALVEGDELVETAMELASACERAGRPEDARGGLERALEVAPENIDLRQKLREVLWAAGANRELAQLVREDASAAADVADRLANLLYAAELYLGPDGDLGEAIAVLSEAQQLSPESIDVVVLMARAYSLSGQSQAAMDMLTQLTQAYKGRRLKALSPVYQEISRIQLEEGFLSDALESLKSAFDMDMRNGPLAHQLGKLALELDEQDIAQRAFRTLSMMKPPRGDDPSEGATSEQKADAHYHLALMARHQGDGRKAKILLGKALSEHAEHEQARALLAELG